MNESRKYAEDLVGALDRSFYEAQRNAKNKKYQTNWKNLQKQYQDLTEDLKLKQEQINTSLANGLATVAENDYLRSRAAANDLAMRGLVASGGQDLSKQANVSTKGGEVFNLLESAGGGSVEIAKALENARQTLVNKEADLNRGLADTLANIGDAEGNALRAYNTGLAEIAGAKDARDMENELAKMQLEAQKQAQAYGKTGLEDAEEAQAQRDLMMDILTNTEYTDDQKATIIRIFFGKGADSAKNIVAGYNAYVDPDSAISDKIKEIKKKISDLKYETVEEYVGNSAPFLGFGGGKEVSSFYDKYSEANKAIEDEKAKLNAEIDALRKSGLKYDEDIAETMYGSNILKDTEQGKNSSNYNYKGIRNKSNNNNVAKTALEMALKQILGDFR